MVRPGKPKAAGVLVGMGPAAAAQRNWGMRGPGGQSPVSEMRNPLPWGHWRHTPAPVPSLWLWINRGNGGSQLPCHQGLPVPTATTGSKPWDAGGRANPWCRNPILLLRVLWQGRVGTWRGGSGPCSSAAAMQSSSSFLAHPVQQPLMQALSKAAHSQTPNARPWAGSSAHTLTLSSRSLCFSMASSSVRPTHSASSSGMANS